MQLTPPCCLSTISVVAGTTLGENIAEYDVRAQTASQEALELAAVTPGGSRNLEGVNVPSCIRSDYGTWDLHPQNHCKLVLQNLGHSKTEAEGILGGAVRKRWMRVCKVMRNGAPRMEWRR